MTPKLFSELGLSPEILKAIDKLGFEQASPIQAAAIPVLLAGKDIVGQSQTGSGKTAAFAIPALEQTDPRSRAVQTLILCPTRELAVQVCEEVHKLAFFKRGIHALPIYGGQSYDRQLYGLRQGAQIVIGTPGRVMDHMERGTLQLDQVRTVILDEADVMLNMGFRDDIEFILKATPTTRQTVFFSATMPRAIRELIETHAKAPENIRIEQQALTVPTIEQIYFEVDRRWKVEALTRLIDVHDLKLGIVFCNTKRMVDELVEHLNTQGYSAEGLHGDLSQNARDRVMNRFRKSGLEFLVATDVAARGIDVDDIQVVVNYDLPYDPEDYVHRIGRTGRAGRSGMAFTFVSGRDFYALRNIERFTKQRLQRGFIPTRDEVEEARANVLLNKVRATMTGGEFDRQEHAVERLLEEGFDTTDIISALLHLLSGGEAPAPEPRRPAAQRPPDETTPAKRPSRSSAPPLPADPGRGEGENTPPPSATSAPEAAAEVGRVTPSPPPTAPDARGGQRTARPTADTKRAAPAAALPHPNPLPLGEGSSSAALANPPSHSPSPSASPVSPQRSNVLPLPAGEGRGEGESVPPPSVTSAPEAAVGVGRVTPSAPPTAPDARGGQRTARPTAKPDSAAPTHTPERQITTPEPQNTAPEAENSATPARISASEAEKGASEGQISASEGVFSSAEAGKSASEAEKSASAALITPSEAEITPSAGQRSASEAPKSAPEALIPPADAGITASEAVISEAAPRTATPPARQPAPSAPSAELSLPARPAGIPKKDVRQAFDRPASRRPVRRDFDHYEDQPYDRPPQEDYRERPAPRRPASRRTPEHMTRLWVSLGDAHGVAPGDFVGCILGETGLPSGTVGVVDIRERHTFVDVAADSANAIIAKLNRTTLRGQRMKVKIA